MFKSILQPILQNIFNGGTLWTESLLNTDILMDLHYQNGIVQSSNIVDSWTDSVSGKVFSETVTENKPILTSDCVTFNGTSQRLYRTIGAEGSFYNQSAIDGIMYHFICKVDSNEIGSASWLLSESNSASNGSYNAVVRGGLLPLKNKTGLAIRTTTSTNILTSNDCVDETVDDTWVDTTNFSLVTIHDNGSVVKTYVNGILQEFTKSYTRSGTLTLNSQTIGGILRPTSNLFFGGGFKRILITKTLTADVLAKLHGRMMWREGLQHRLNVNHPYYFIPPLNFLTPVQNLYKLAITLYGLRKLNPDYNGNCIRIRRSSDNAETDIGFINNLLDTTSIIDFVGSNNAFVTTWYDQSRKGSNAIQTTASNQPRIVNAGTIYTENGKPSIEFLGTSLLISQSALPTGTTQFTGNVVGKRTAGTFARLMSLAVSGTSDTDGTSNAVVIFSGTNNINSYRNVTFYSTKTGTTNVLFIASSIYNATSNIVYLNGSAGNTTTFNQQPLGSVKIGLGQQAGGTTPATDWLTGAISEVTYFTSALLTTDRQLVEADQGSFYSVSIV